MSEPQGPPEPVMVKCARCGVPIRSLWAPGNRGLLAGDYVLVADWLFHPACFDEMTAAYDPSPSHPLSVHGGGR